jgi:hypothetical protein
VFLDEAFDIAPAAMGATIPTLSTRPGAQVYYTSSAPHESSQVLHAVRSRAMTDDPLDRLFYAEWGNPVEALQLDANDPAFMEAIRTANPAVQAGRITEEYIIQEIRTFSGDADLVEEHRRERLGVPSMAFSATASIIPLDQWDALKAESSPIVSGESFALDVSPDRQKASFAVAGRCADGLVQVEVFDNRPGTGWIVERAVQLHQDHGKPIRIEKGGPAGSFVSLLTEAGVVVEEVSTADHARATGQFIDAVSSSTLRHLGDPILRTAIVGATLRHTGDADLWSRRSSRVDITPLVACTLALGGVPEVQYLEPTFYSLDDFLTD